MEKAIQEAGARPARDGRGGRRCGGAAPGVTGTPLPLATGNGNGAPAALDDWSALDGVDDLAEDESRLVTVGQERLLVAHVETGTPGVPRRLQGLRLVARGGGAAREGCSPARPAGAAYFLPRAGRSLDGERIQLDPVPLLADPRFGARVALPS